MKRRWKEWTDNLYAIVTGRVRKGTDLNRLCNPALFHVDRRTCTPSLKNTPSLTVEQKKAVREFYRPYVPFVSTRFHRLYLSQSGHGFDPRYIPEDLHFTRIDRYLCDREAARFLDNKCYYYRFFSNVKQPQLVCMRVGNTWLDKELQPVSFDCAVEKVRQEEEVVVKQAAFSEFGVGVFFLREEPGKEIGEQFTQTVRTMKEDILVQKPIRQHEQLAALHPQSVNTLRVLSLLSEDKVKILGACLRIGTEGSRVDNTSMGGILCGVMEDGRLSGYGLYHDGNRIESHPQLGYRFADKRVPNLPGVYELVRKAHGFAGHFRILYWDIAIDEQGDAVLVEVNFCLGRISAFQAFHGPLFGEDTEKILNEVFGRKGIRRWMERKGK